MANARQGQLRANEPHLRETSNGPPSECRTGLCQWHGRARAASCARASSSSRPSPGSSVSAPKIPQGSADRLGGGTLRGSRGWLVATASQQTLAYSRSSMYGLKGNQGQPSEREYTQL